MIKLAITDDQVIILNGLQKILADVQNIRITGVYNNGDELLEGIAKEQPDVLLLDIQMPGKSGIELAAVITKQYRDIKIIALTNIDVVAQIKKILQQGVMGYLLKDANPATIINAIETVYGGEQYIQEQLRQQLLNSLSAGNAKQIVTRREKEILQLIVDEFTNQEIADKLFLSLRTVENHRNNLLQKLDVKNTAGLVKVAIQEGLVT
ncbi:MAG TPA: response regulator transcription factor [Ferruginibacter sp.]|nr:response regulator transcription factor [Ferruginibacter sp.]HPH89611.1 response regulator transcription factor [Ferruginibacter sp.]